MWDRLRAKYFEEWRQADSVEWHGIKAKLEIIEDVRKELRKIDNA